MLSLTNIFLQLDIFSPYMTAFGGWSKLRHLLGKSCPIIRKFQDMKSPLEPTNFVSRVITVFNTIYIYIYIYIYVWSQVESYQRLKKWYLIRLCLRLSTIRYVSRIKWSNPGKGVAPSPAPQCSSNWKLVSIYPRIAIV